MLQPFVWQGNTGGIKSPAQVERERQMAEALLSPRPVAQNGWEGISQLAQAISGTVQRNRADEATAAGQEKAAALLGGISSSSSPDALIQALTSPDAAWLSPEQSNIGSALLSQGLERADPMYQIQLQAAQQGLDKGAFELDALRNPPPAPADYGFIELPNGQIVRTDATSGTVADMGQFGGAVPEAPELVELFDETTGLPYKARWNAQEGRFEREGGLKAPTNGMTVTTNPDGTTTVSMGGSGKFDSTVGGEFGKMYSDMQSQGMNAVQGLDTLSAMETQMADPSFYSGFGGEQVLALKQAAAALGVDPEGVKSMETFNALSKQAALASMGGSLGAGFSNADRSFVEQQVASLGSTPEGNKKLIDLQRKILQRKIDIAIMADRYQKANGQLDGGFTTELENFSKANPLFGEAEKPAPGMSEVPSFSSEADYNAAPSGTVFKAPDGSIRVKP